MMLSKLIERIDISSSYELKICSPISYIQFCGIGEETPQQR